ncbi:hypothetical protein [Luteibacter yeojuensis]|uniref:hypothetical protein n=1 Tax=Luteibacter yeojuensis TaxID=345309 RepID=UPI0018DB1D1F|nr:hypothetical protein [Luteibacter yeojuensis]
MRWLALATTLGVAACSPVKQPARSVADGDPLRTAVVTDIVETMIAMYAPGVTPLAPARAMGGPFETALLGALRGRGYDVLITPGRGAAFDCHVDVLEGPVYRVVVSVGDSRLSRLWVVKGGEAYAGGAWAYRE